MDQFKKYLREHRHELDVEKPPASPLWHQKKEPIKQSLVIDARKWIAAASIILIVSSVLYWWLLKADTTVTTPGTIVQNDSNILPQPTDSIVNDTPLPVNEEPKTTQGAAVQPAESKRKQSQVSRKTNKSSKPKTSPLKSLETNYATIINYQLKRLERTPIYAESPDYFHVFKKQWYDLEKDEEKVKRDVRIYGLTDIIVDQFIQLYQNKIGLLKQLQTEIDKMNLRARNHPGFESQTPTYLKM